MVDDTSWDELIWGAENMAAEVGRKVRQIYYFIEKGDNPLPVKRVGSRTLCISRTVLWAYFGVSPPPAKKSPPQEPACEPFERTRALSRYTQCINDEIRAVAAHHDREMNEIAAHAKRTMDDLDTAFDRARLLGS
jgi:hypothetical protein